MSRATEPNSTAFANTSRERHARCATPRKREESPSHGLSSRSRDTDAAGSEDTSARALRWRLWSPLVARVGGAVLGMLALAAIGATATHKGNGTRMSLRELASTVQSAQGGVEWLQPTSPPVLAASVTDTASAPVSAAPHADAPGEPAPASASAGVTADGKVILNLAGVDELTQLPGVGQKRALAIVELRERLKRFKSPNQLLQVRGIGVKSLKKMLPFLVLDPPAPAAPAAPTPPSAPPEPPVTPTPP